MITRCHRIDKHKKYSNISVLNRQDEKVDFKQRCCNLKEYIGNLVVAYDVMFKRICSLFQWVYSGRGDGTHVRRLKQVSSIPLLILDDFGLNSLTSEQQTDLFELSVYAMRNIPPSLPVIVTSMFGPWCFRTL